MSRFVATQGPTCNIPNTHTKLVSLTFSQNLIKKKVRVCAENRQCITIMYVEHSRNKIMLTKKKGGPKLGRSGWSNN